MRKICLLLLMFAGLSLQAQPDRIYTSLSDVKDPSQVYQLKLNYKRLKVIPPQVFDYTNLRVLDLSKNFIDSLPPQIARLEHLESLNLSRNHLHSVPDSIGFLSELKVLNVSRNPILDLPETLGQLTKLEELIVWMTGIVSLPPTCFTLNYSLRLLDMRACPMTYDNQQAIEEMLPSPRKRWDYVCNCR